MKYNKFSLTNFLLIIVLSASAVFAGKLTADNKNVVLVGQNLSAKLKTDLAAENLSIKFTNVEETVLSNSQILLKGDAFAVLPSENTELPIKFEAKVNTSEEIVNDVAYNFVESSYVPTTDEEFLMKNLLQKIAADYKTENVVIAIDGFETQDLTNKKEYKGLAEIRVGDLEWKKIDFDVVLNGTNAAEKIEYKIKP